MARWLRINEDLFINMDQVTYVECGDDGSAALWLAYSIEDQEAGIMADLVVLDAGDAQHLRRYLSRCADDVRLEE